MNLHLRNHSALVTGSTAGIGFAIAKALAAGGARVTINGRTQERVDAALAELREALPMDAVITGVAADASTAEGCVRITERTPDVDILINNLGIFEPTPFERIADEAWQRLFDANVMSGVRLSRHYFPRMMGRNRGRVVFVSSESALNIPAEMIHYGMTKTAQLAVARGLAELTVGTAVTVNSVLPGPTRSEGVETFIKQLAAQGKIDAAEVEREFFRTARPTSLLKRFQTPDEIAAVVAFIASPAASAINGAAVRADGGVVRSIV